MKTTEIIQKVLDIVNLDATHLAIEIGANQSRINDILSGRTKKITSNTADLIIKRFPNLSRNFLITGIGSPFVDGAHVEPYIDEPRLSPSQVLQTFLDYYNINRRNLSLLTGISEGNLSNILSGNNRPRNISKQNAQRIIAAFPDIRLEWLVNGKGPMFRNGQNAPSLSTLQGTAAVSDLPEISASAPSASATVPSASPAVAPSATVLGGTSASVPQPLTREDVAAMIKEATAASDAKTAEKFDKILSLLETRTGFAAEE